MADLTNQSAAINRVAPKKGLFSSLGLYKETPVTGDSVTFTVQENSLTVLDDHLRNVAQKNSTQDAPTALHTLAIPHYPIVKTIGREKIGGFGGVDDMNVAIAVAKELEEQAETHDLHEEFLIAQMTLNGIVSTSNYGDIDMAEEFGVTREGQALDGDDLLSSIRKATAKSKAGLRNGGYVKGYTMFVGAEMFDELLRSSDVREAFQFSQGNNPLRNELGTVADGYTMFRFGNVNIILYDDTFTTKDGNLELLETDKGVLIPRTSLGRIFYGSDSTLEGLGRVGNKRFAQTYRDPKGRYIEVESEQSTLVVNEQFAATVELSLA